MGISVIFLFQFFFFSFGLIGFGQVRPVLCKKKEMKNSSGPAARVRELTNMYVSSFPLFFFISSVASSSSPSSSSVLLLFPKFFY